MKTIEHDEIVRRIKSSERYRNLSEEKRKEIDSFLNSDEIRNKLERGVVELSFYESFVSAVLNSESFKEIEDKERVRSYLESENFRNFMDNLEKTFENPFNLKFGEF